MTEIYKITDTLLYKHGVCVPQPVPETLRKQLESEAKWNADKVRIYRRERERQLYEKGNATREFILGICCVFSTYGFVRMVMDIAHFFGGSK